MTRGELIERANLYVAKIKQSKIERSVIESLIQEAADDICRALVLLPDSKTFASVEDQYDYLLNEIDEDCLCVDKQGILFNKGTASVPDWEPLDPYTDIQMENEFRNWRNDSSADPQRYWVKRNTISVHPKPSTALTNGFWIYFGKRPTRMTNDSSYPFTGTTSEIPAFNSFDEAILLYVKWKLKIAQDAKPEEIASAEKAYYAKLLIEDSVITRNKPFSGKGRLGFRRIPSVKRVGR